MKLKFWYGRTHTLIYKHSFEFSENINTNLIQTAIRANDKISTKGECLRYEVLA